MADFYAARDITTTPLPWPSIAPPITAATNSLSSEASKALEKYWSQEDGRRAAMEEFRSALTELVATKPKEDGEDPSNGTALIIVIDELDRCRPDYALEVLEIIKHFFSIPRISFVLSVNLTALENSVRSRYGLKIDASAYLRKFINVLLSLPSEIGPHYSSRDTISVYLEHQVEEMGIPAHIAEPLTRHIEIVARNNVISIRDVGKILTATTLLSGDVLRNETYFRGWIDVMIALLVSQVIRPDMYKRFISLSISGEDLEEYFDATLERRSRRTESEQRTAYDHYTMSQYYLWIYIINGGDLPGRSDSLKKLIAGSLSDWPGGPDNPRSIPKKVQRDWLDLFKTHDA